MSTVYAIKVLEIAMQIAAIVEQAHRIAQLTKSAIERAREEGRDLTDEDLAALDAETKAALDGLRAALDKHRE